MTYKEARDRLQQVADSTTLAGYGTALSKAIEALEMAEQLNAEKTQLLEDLKQSIRHEPCDNCKYSKEHIPCEGEDYLCDVCTHHGCICHDCRDASKWEWRGVKKRRADNG